MTPQIVPKVMYALWFQGLEAAPDLVRFNLRRWQALNPEYRLEVLAQADVDALLADTAIPAALLRPQALSNIVRTRLLLDRGGVWLDASLMPVRPLREWLEPAVAGTGFFAFDRPGPDRLLSSWFLAGVPGHPLLAAWWRELVRYWDRPRTLVKGYPEDPVQAVSPDGGAQEDTYPYHAYHYLFGYATAHDPDLARRWAACVKFPAGPAHRLYRLFKRYPAAPAPLIRLVASTSPVQKLNWRESYDLDRM